MRILVVIPSLHRGGAERVVSLLSQEWVKDHEVRIALFDASSPCYSYGGSLIDLEVSAKPGILSKSIQAIRRVVELVRLIGNYSPDRIFSFMESANFPSIIAAMLTGVRSQLCVSVRNNPAHFPTYYRKLIPHLYRLPGQVVAVSSGVAQALFQLGLSKTMVKVIPNPSSIQPSTLSTCFVRPIGAPESYILGVGRLHRQKGFDLLIEAFSGANDQNLHLVLLGDGDERPSLEAQASKLGVSNRVHMPGEVVDVRPWYRNALCFVLSSRYEGWPNVLFEAMGQDCAVVSFDCKYGPSEIVEHGVSGYLVADGDIVTLKESLSLLINNSAQRKALALGGRKRAAEFDVSLLAKKWLY